LRYAIISDIHGNREALDAVLESILKLKCDKILCLGDIVGYGAEPGYCVDRVREVSSAVVAGNHDFAVLGRINIEYFNPHARHATLWTRAKLNEAQTKYLESLPLSVVLDTCTLVHGSLDAPELFDYIQTSYDAFLTMENMTSRACFIGHSHVPIFFLLDEVITYSLESSVQLKPYKKAIINVGSVGQPRDNNPMACFAVYDDDALAVTLHRTPYDIEKSAAKILEAGLPDFLAERLIVGR
jgi:diadenosine tetraphosphatase ApaH/serine/threonine PP2A family protein phosphatase